MKIGFVVGEFPLLSHTFVISQIEAMMRRGFDVSIVCDRIGSDSTNRRRGRADAHHAGKHTSLVAAADWSRRRRASLAGRAAGQGFDRSRHAVDAGTQQMRSAARPFRRQWAQAGASEKRNRLAPPIVTIFHGNDVGIPAHDGTLARYLPLFQHGAHQLTVNDVFRRALIKAGAPERQVSVHRMGIDCGDIAYRPRETRPRPAAADFSLPPRRKEGHCLCAARRRRAAGSKANHRLALLDRRRRTAARCVAQPCPGAWHRGQGPSFTARSRTADVKDQLAGAHVFLLPSVTAANGDVEGVPVALMEAMAAGLMAVSTYHSGIPELVENRPDRFACAGEGRRRARRASDLDRRQSLRRHADHAGRPRAYRGRVQQRILNDRLAADDHVPLASEKGGMNAPVQFGKVALRGSLVTGVSQGMKIGLQFLSVIVLARLLVPEDFGLVAAVGPIVAFVALFQNLGLQQAVVQRHDISDQQLNRMFWVMAAVGLACTAIVLAVSPLVAWFYGDPRMRDITIAAGLPLLARQHGRAAAQPAQPPPALRPVGDDRRRQRACSASWPRRRRLLWPRLLVAAASARPSRPPYRWQSPGIGAAGCPAGPISAIDRDIMSFGANLTGFNLANFFARNLDNILIGKYSGAIELGYYDRAYKLLLFPIQNIITPLSRVMIPLLSRVQDDKPRFRELYLQTPGCWPSSPSRALPR